MLGALNRERHKAESPKWSLIPPSAENGEVINDPLEGWSKRRKLAAFLIMLGREQATILLREFEDREVADIILEMAAMETVSLEQQEAILREFAEVAHMANVSKRGGPDFAREVLEMRLGTVKANEIINRIAPNHVRPSDRKPKPQPETETVVARKWDPESIFHSLCNENLQTQAMVISYMMPADGARVLVQFSPPHRVEIIERLGMMEPLPVEFVEQILNKVKERCSMKDGPQFTRSGGAESLAKILNSMKEADLQQTLTELQARNPALGKKVKQLLFVFDDIANLDDATIMEITKNVEMSDLAKALKTAPEGVKEAIFRTFPKRRAEFLKEEMDNLPAIRMTEVQAIQAKIVQVVNDLQDQGLIHISRLDKMA